MKSYMIHIIHLSVKIRLDKYFIYPRRKIILVLFVVRVRVRQL